MTARISRAFLNLGTIVRVICKRHPERVPFIWAGVVREIRGV